MLIHKIWFIQYTSSRRLTPVRIGALPPSCLYLFTKFYGHRSSSTQLHIYETTSQLKLKKLQQSPGSKHNWRPHHVSSLWSFIFRTLFSAQRDLVCFALYKICELLLFLLFPKSITGTSSTNAIRKFLFVPPMISHGNQSDLFIKKKSFLVFLEPTGHAYPTPFMYPVGALGSRK